jgi:hypothetical protein
MSLITAPTSLYDAFLTLATPQERDAIINGGPRQHLHHILAFGTQEQFDNASAAYGAIRTIIARIGADKTLRIVGIDSRMMPPKWEIVDAEVVLTGRLMWEGDNGVQSKLQMEWMSPPIYIANLRIEPVEQASNAALVMAPSAQLAPGERKDDTERLRLMQKGMDDGLPPKTAARGAARALPDPPTGEENVASRLVRKFKKRLSR